MCILRSIIFLIILIHYFSNLHLHISFDSTDGQLTDTGAFAFKYEELSPGGNIAFNITVQPKLSGLYESTRARIRYTTGIAYEDSEDDVRKGSSSSLGRVRIMSKAEFARRKELFPKEWIFYLVVGALVAIISFQLWSSSRQQAPAKSTTATKKKSS